MRLTRCLGLDLQWQAGVHSVLDLPFRIELHVILLLGYISD